MEQFRCQKKTAFTGGFLMRGNVGNIGTVTHILAVSLFPEALSGPFTGLSECRVVGAQHFQHFGTAEFRRHGMSFGQPLAQLSA